MPIRRAPLSERGYNRLPNRIVEDKRLSWAARGMIAHLLSKPDNWSVNITALINETRQAAMPSKRDAVYRIVDELMKAGYFTRQRRADGSLEYTVHEMPIAINADGGADPHPDNPEVRTEPHPGKPDEDAAQGFAGDAFDPHPDNPEVRTEPHPENPDQENPDPDFPDVYQLLNKAPTTEKAPTKPCAVRTAHARTHIGFDSFYAAYPKKRDRARAQTAFTKLAPDETLLTMMLAALEAQKRSDEWRREGGKFVPHPATWLNGRRWEDEVEPGTYLSDEQEVIAAYNEAMPETWPRAVDAPYSAKRAAAIREFRTFGPKPDAVPRYFAYCAANVTRDEWRGLDWLINRETYLRMREGAVRPRESA